MTAREEAMEQSRIEKRFDPVRTRPTPEILADLRAKAQAATPGPWMWCGQKGWDYELATKRWGRRWIMRFQRMGMQGAQPVFQQYEPGDQTGPDPFFWAGRMVPAQELAIQEVPYRRDIVAIDNPDARYIARMDATTTLDLLDYIEELEERLDSIEQDAIEASERADD